MKKPSSFCTNTACFLETVTSSRKMSQSGERPMVVRSPCGTKCSPARPPPERTTSAGPSAPSSSSVGTASSSPSSGVKLMVVSEPGSSLTRSAPHLEQ